MPASPRRRFATITRSFRLRFIRQSDRDGSRSNVAEMAKPPRVTQKQVHAPSLDVVREVIEAAERRDPRLAPLLMLAALTGMRRGELCALRWSDVDFQAETLTVNHSVVVAPKGLVEKIGLWRWARLLSPCYSSIAPELRNGSAKRR